MRTPVPEKLLKIVDDIDARGDANLTRLTVLKKWFETSGQIAPFALWIASRATDITTQSVIPQLGLCPQGWK